MLSRMLRVMKLDSSVYEEVEHDQSATGQAVLVVIVVSILSGLGKIVGGGVMTVLFAIVVTLIGWVVMSFVSLGIGRLFGGKADMGELLRALGFAYTPQVLGLIPFIGWLLALVLGLIAWVQALRESLDISTGKAVLTAILSVIAFVILLIPVMILFGIGGALFSGGAS